LVLLHSCRGRTGGRAARVFFSKGGERSKIKPVGYAFIVLLVVSAAYGAYDLYSKAEQRKQDKIIRDEEKASEDARREELKAQVGI
jgi:hypothetical protein